MTLSAIWRGVSMRKQCSVSLRFVARLLDGEAMSEVCRSCTTVSDRNKKPCNFSITRSARGCYLCLRYNPLPMSPGRTVPNWRMGWDSNPRRACTLAGFQDRFLKPLGHPSGDALIAQDRCLSRPIGRARRRLAEIMYIHGFTSAVWRIRSRYVGAFTKERPHVHHPRLQVWK